MLLENALNTTPQSAVWTAFDGSKFEFHVYGKGMQWPDRGGVYIFAYFDGTTWWPVYIGQTNSFKARLTGHPQWDQAVKCGATHVLIRYVDDALTREVLEERLIRSLQPSLNHQLK